MDVKAVAFLVVLAIASSRKMVRKRIELFLLTKLWTGQWCLSGTTPQPEPRWTHARTHALEGSRFSFCMFIVDLQSLIIRLNLKMLGKIKQHHTSEKRIYDNRLSWLYLCTFASDQSLSAKELLKTGFEFWSVFIFEQIWFRLVTCPYEAHIHTARFCI